MTYNEYMRDYMRARRHPDQYARIPRSRNLGSAIGLTQADIDRRDDAERGSRALLERINALRGRMAGGE